jgi:DNA-binding transcriptional LysR family regulator
MIDFKRMAVFATVVELGSLSAAGRRLGMTTSAVSQHLRALEQAYGVALLHRSTRKISLTDAGARFCRHCQAMLAAAGAAHEQLSLAHEAPTGQLRLSSPVGFVRHVAPALAPVLTTYPQLKLHMAVADEMIDLIDARIDLAVRAGRLADSNWVARRICALESLICAAPSYIAQYGEPATPSDLAAHRWITASQQEDIDIDVRLIGPDGSSEPLRVEPHITSNNHMAVLQLCVAGQGLALMIRADVDDELRRGQLVPVMSGWHLPPLPVWVVTPQRDTQPAKVRHAIEALRIYFLQSVPGVVGGT